MTATAAPALTALAVSGVDLPASTRVTCPVLAADLRRIEAAGDEAAAHGRFDEADSAYRLADVLAAR